MCARERWCVRAHARVCVQESDMSNSSHLTFKEFLLSICIGFLLDVRIVCARERVCTRLLARARV